MPCSLANAITEPEKVMAPMIKRRKGEHKEVFEEARKAGYVRVRVNGDVRDLSESFDLVDHRFDPGPVPLEWERAALLGDDSHESEAERLEDPGGDLGRLDPGLQFQPRLGHVVDQRSLVGQPDALVVFADP